MSTDVYLDIYQNKTTIYSINLGHTAILSASYDDGIYFWLRKYCVFEPILRQDVINTIMLAMDTHIEDVKTAIAVTWTHMLSLQGISQYGENDEFLHSAFDETITLHYMYHALISNINCKWSMRVD